MFIVIPEPLSASLLQCVYVFVCVCACVCVCVCMCVLVWGWGSVGQDFV